MATYLLKTKPEETGILPFLSKTILLTFNQRDYYSFIENNKSLRHCKWFIADEFINRSQSTLVSLPLGIIIAYKEETRNEILTFAKKLYDLKKFNYIPILLIGSSEIIEKIRMNPILVSCFDDIINENITALELKDKIKFLRKIKKMDLSEMEKTRRKSASQSTRKKILRRLGSITKRCIDIVGAGLLLLLLSPLFLIVAILIKIDSKGPIFYKSSRTGTDYKIFKFIKFRTMVQDADKKIETLENQYEHEDGETTVFYKFKNDPRITRIGSFLRKTSIDELPQLINVLRGEMSLVGNRPLPLYEAQQLTVDHFVQRFNAPAGITGLWQVKKRGKSEMSVDERILLDVFYAKHQSLGLDLKILMETPRAIIQDEDV